MNHQEALLRRALIADKSIGTKRSQGFQALKSAQNRVFMKKPYRRSFEAYQSSLEFLSDQEVS